MVAGSPSSLLKLFGLAAVRKVRANTAAARSLTVVLPTDPVTPTTRSPRRVRANRARSINAADVFATTTAVARRSSSPSLVR